jgi:hypothetical protein
MNLQASSDDIYGAAIWFTKTYGSVAAPTVVVDQVGMGGIAWMTYFGGALVSTASIGAYRDGATGAGVPGAMWINLVTADAVHHRRVDLRPLGAYFNKDLEDWDFSVGTDSTADAFLVDGGANTATFNVPLTVVGNIAATNLSGTNTGNVTLAGETYITIAGQVITAADINLATQVTGTLDSANIDQSLSIATLALSGAITQAADTDVNNVFGRSKVFAIATDYASFAHYDHASLSNYGFAQGPSTDGTFINTPTGGLITFRVNNAQIMRMDATGLGIGMTPVRTLDVTGTFGVTGVATLITGVNTPKVRSVTIASGTLAVTSADLWLNITPEGGADDTLDTITGGTLGQHLYITAVSNIITLIHFSGAGSFIINTAANKTMQWYQLFHFIHNGTYWFEVAS